MKAACFMLGVGGADANGVDSRLLSPLHLVALFNRPDIARVLLMCGASPRLQGGVTRAAAARGGKLWSPLDMAEEACTEGGALDEGEKRTTNASTGCLLSRVPPPSVLWVVWCCSVGTCTTLRPLVLDGVCWCSTVVGGV